MPRYIEEGWEVYDEATDSYVLKPNAPDWARKEFEEFHRNLEQADGDRITVA